MTDVFVRLFGGPLVVAGEVQPALTPAQRRLLAIVYASAPDPVTREEVSWLLWEEGETAETRHRLRQLIYAINRPHPTPVLERRGDVIVPCLPTDAHDVEPGLGHPLRLVTSTGNASFEHWLDTTRTRLSRNRRRHFAAALDRAMAAEDWLQIYSVVEALLAVSETPATWIDIFLQSAVRSGSVQHARAVADELFEERQLGHAERTRVDEFLLSVPERLTVPANGHSPLIGRDRELRWLQKRIWQHAGIHFTLLKGPSGIGKTRLLEELGRWAAAEDASVAFVSSRESLSTTPLSTIAQVLAEVHPRPDHASGANHVGSPGIPAPVRGEGGSALSDTFSKALRPGLTVLIIDDAQWADPTSLLWLQSLKLLRSDASVSVIMSVRTQEGHKLTPRLEAFTQSVRAEDLWLAGLPPTNCSTLAEGHEIALPGPAHLDALHRLSRGNPMEFLDLARGWAEEDWRSDRIPKSLRRRVGRMLSPLGRIERLVLALIAAVESISSSDLVEVLSEPIWHITDCLAVLTNAGLIAHSGSRYSFPHTMLRYAVSGHLGEVMLNEAHLLVARWLKGQTADPSRIVYHYRVANAHQLAGAWALQAARSAVRSDAQVEAMRFYEYALESDELAADPNVVAEAGRLAISLCDFVKGSHFLSRATHLSPSPDPLWEVDRLNAESEAGHLSHAEASDRIVAIGQHALEHQEWAVAFPTMEAGIRVMERVGDWKGVIRLLERVSFVKPRDDEAQILQGMLLALGSVYGSPDVASDQARRAYRLARKKQASTDLLPRAAHRLFVVLLSEGRVATPLGASCLDILRTKAQSSGSLKLRYTAIANEAVWHLDTGDLATAGNLLDQAEDVVRGSDAHNELQNLATNRGYLYLRQGSPELALEYFEQARDLISLGTRSFLTDIVRAGIGLCHLRAGRLRNAELQLEELATYDYYFFDPSLLIRLPVEVRWRRGRRDDALRYLAAERQGIACRFVPQYLDLTLFEARLRARVGDLQGSMELAEEVRLTAADRSLSHFGELAAAVSRAAADKQ